MLAFSITQLSTTTAATAAAAAALHFYLIYVVCETYSKVFVIHVRLLT